MISRFNVRVYALITNEKGQVLLADEEYDGRKFTKFPGGGVEFGEGVLDALQRESREELGQELKELSQFYTTDFFQPSMFRPSDQIISIYYKAKLTKPEELKLAKFPFDFTHGKPAFRWKDLEELKSEGMELPIDKVVLKLL